MNDKAFGKFYREQREPFVRWLQKKYPISIKDATDIYQDSILVVYRNLKNGSFDETKSKLTTYLFAIGRNICVKLLKDRNKIPPNPEYQESTVTNVSDKRIKAVKSLLVKMKEPCKSIVTGLYLHEMNPEQIAQKLNYRNLRVFYTQKSRCIKKIKLALKKHYPKD